MSLSSGENFGTGQQDLADVVILGQDMFMTAQWISPSKITALCPGNASEREGEIIIVTKSGGQGSCNVPFRVYREKITPLTQIASWIPEKVPFSKKRNRNFNASNRQDFDDALQLSVKVQELNEEIVPILFASKQSGKSQWEMMMVVYLM